MNFQLNAPFSLSPPQKNVVETLLKDYQEGERFQTLLGITGSGKTFVMASLIALLNRPTLVVSHNKTLAAQLFQELRNFFPQNAVEYFISFYDYYLPEAYIPSTDTYIAKETLINREIDRMRLSATRSLHERRDTVIVSSVSCIYGMGNPADYFSQKAVLKENQVWPRKVLLSLLTDLRYQRSDDVLLEPGCFRLRGNILDLYPPYTSQGLRLEFVDDILDSLTLFDPVTSFSLQKVEEFNIYPTNYFVTPDEKLKKAIPLIRGELESRLQELRDMGKHKEAQRLEERTEYDLELMAEMGYCPGIENYSRHLTFRQAGDPPFTLLDYFPSDFFMIIDESHMTVPQMRAMYSGDRSRKSTLVENGFRLPSALDNRPLTFREIEKRFPQTLFVSATPGEYELEQSHGRPTEMVLRPTGLLDPETEVRPTTGQMENLLEEIRARTAAGERTLITTLTKKMAEKLTAFLYEKGIKSKYLHSDVDTLDRIKILKEFRQGEFDALVGINLLREGLDLPEVSLVAILDADKEGFLRSQTALVQTFGRAARNLHGKVILYADQITPSMEKAIQITGDRRELQNSYNIEHNIVPQTIKKPIAAYLSSPESPLMRVAERKTIFSSREEGELLLEKLTAEMKEKAQKWEFEQAAKIRDQIKALEELLLTL